MGLLETKFNEKICIKTHLHSSKWVWKCCLQNDTILFKPKCVDWPWGDSDMSEENSRPLKKFICDGQGFMRPVINLVAGYALVLALYRGIILGVGLANERRRYIVTSSLIGWAHTQNGPCWIVLMKHTNILYCFILSQHWHGAGRWNPSWWKIRSGLSCMFNTMAADDLVMQGASALTSVAFT